MFESLSEAVWLYRGVPATSPEVADVEANSEVYPRKPEYVGEYARYCHSVYEMTDTGYTSWTTDRELAIELAQFAIDNLNLNCGYVIFRVRVDSLDESRVFEGLESEYEYLIEGTVDDVEISENGDEDE